MKLMSDKIEYEKIAAEDARAESEQADKETVLTIACEGGAADIFRRRNESGAWVFFSEGSTLDDDDEAGSRSWRKAESAMLTEAIKAEIDDYQIFMFTPLFIHPEHLAEVRNYLENLHANLSEPERARLQRFAEHSVITPDDWLAKARRRNKNK